jgi:hypothetical protein
MLNPGERLTGRRKERTSRDRRRGEPITSLDDGFHSRFVDNHCAEHHVIRPPQIVIRKLHHIEVRQFDSPNRQAREPQPSATREVGTLRVFENTLRKPRNFRA